MSASSSRRGARILPLIQTRYAPDGRPRVEAGQVVWDEFAGCGGRHVLRSGPEPGVLGYQCGPGGSHVAALNGRLVDGLVPMAPA